MSPGPELNRLEAAEGQLESGTGMGTHLFPIWQPLPVSPQSAEKVSGRSGGES